MKESTKEKLRDAWGKFKEWIDDGFHAFVIWFHLNVKPELKQFLMDNMHLAKKVVIEVATEFAGQPDHLKFSSAIEKLGRESLREVPNLKISNGVLGLLIELAFQALKASGKLPSNR